MGEKKLCKLVETFLCGETGMGEAWMSRHPGRLLRFGDQIYLVPEEMFILWTFSPGRSNSTTSQ